MKCCGSLRMARAHETGSVARRCGRWKNCCSGLAPARADAHLHAPLSLDGPLSVAEPCEGSAAADPADAIVERAERDAVRKVLAALPKRQRTLVYLHYWNGVSLRSVSRQMMVSPQRVSQIHLGALRNMREAMQQHKRY